MDTIITQVLEALKSYDGSDFIVNDELLEFIENINVSNKSTTKSFKESFELLNQFLADLKLPSLSERVAKMDWGITGGEEVEELKILANDYASDVASERSESKESWRYEH
jgi:hypothetical protein